MPLFAQNASGETPFSAKSLPPATASVGKDVARFKHLTRTGIATQRG